MELFIFYLYEKTVMKMEIFTSTIDAGGERIFLFYNTILQKLYGDFCA